MSHLTIGEVAKISNLSIQTLRYYDKINLFKPQSINPTNHYRYYTIQQLFYLETIKYLRKIKLPIKEIKKVIALEPEQLQLFLQRYQTTIEKQINELKIIKQLLKNQDEQLQIQQSLLNKEDGKVYYRNLQERTILTSSNFQKLTPLDYPDLSFSELYNILAQNHLPKSYQYNCVYPLKDYTSLSQIKYSYIFIKTR